MAIVEIESKVYKVEDKVAEKILDMSYKIEELEIEVGKLKKDVLDGEIHWHSQKQKRLAEKRKKLKYKQTINETIEYIEQNTEYLDIEKGEVFSCMGAKNKRIAIIGTSGLLNKIKGEENE